VKGQQHSNKQRSSDDDPSNKRLKMANDGKCVLVTGGCGYIGTHTIVCLLEQGYNVVVVDNMSNSSSVSLDAVAEIAQLGGEERSKRLILHEVDVCDKEALRKVFETSPTFQACIHFAGLKVSM
jgi:UDP-glucose 4-epimerase